MTLSLSLCIPWVIRHSPLCSKYLPKIDNPENTESGPADKNYRLPIKTTSCTSIDMFLRQVILKRYSLGYVGYVGQPCSPRVLALVLLCHPHTVCVLKCVSSVGTDAGVGFVPYPRGIHQG